MLTYIYSTVNAGKSANLIMRAHSCEERKIGFRVLVPQVAALRDESSRVASRIGFSQKAHSLWEGQCPYEYIQSQMAIGFAPIKVVFVDEAQFLTRAQVLGLTRIVDELGIPVFAYGLRTDFKGEPFEGSIYLLSWSERIEEISTFSDSSAECATFNMKVDELGAQVTSGNSVDPGFGYTPVTRKKFGLARISVKK